MCAERRRPAVGRRFEYVLWASVIGLLIRNVIGLPPLFRPGMASYEF
jgi:hypothetical protein